MKNYTNVSIGLIFLGVLAWLISGTNSHPLETVGIVLVIVGAILLLPASLRR